MDKPRLVRPAPEGSADGKPEPPVGVEAPSLAQPVESAEVAAEYMVADEPNHILVRIYNRRTGQTIRLIPPTLIVSAILKALGVKSVSRLDRLL